jgi:hypothetical protein
MPDCWLEVSLHPDGPATGQLDQGFPWFSSVLEQMPSWYPEFQVALHASHAALPLETSRFRPNVALPMLVQFSQYCSPSGVCVGEVSEVRLC